MLVVWAVGMGLFIHAQFARWRTFRKKRSVGEKLSREEKITFNVRELIIAGSTVGLSYLIDWLRS